MLHEQLYKTVSGSRIALSDYMRNLASYLGGVAPDNVQIVTEADPVTVSSKQAGLVGTLVDEFTTNAFKHAFPGGRSGVARFALHDLGDDRARLDLSDDGVGLPPAGAMPHAGLGMQIITAIGQQLGGNVIIDRNRGGAFISVAFAAARV